MRFKFGNLVRFVGDRRLYKGLGIKKDALAVVLKHHRINDVVDDLEAYNVELVFKDSTKYSDYVRADDLELVS